MGGITAIYGAPPTVTTDTRLAGTLAEAQHRLRHAELGALLVIIDTLLDTPAMLGGYDTAAERLAGIEAKLATPAPASVEGLRKLGSGATDAMPGNALLSLTLGNIADMQIDTSRLDAFDVPILAYDKSIGKFVVVDGTALGLTIPGSTTSSLLASAYERAAIVGATGIEQFAIINSAAALGSPHATGGTGTGTWYVDATAGTDAGSGTISAPYRTITKAVAVATAGDYIVLRAGTYREAVGSTAKAFKLQPHKVGTEVEEVRITGADAFASTWTATAQGWRLDNVIAGSISRPSASDVFTATTGAPFSAAWIGAKVTGTGIAAGATITAMSGSASTADGTRYAAVVLSTGTSTTGAVSGGARIGVAPALNRAAMTTSTDSTSGYDPAIVGTNPALNSAAGDPGALFLDGAKQKQVAYSSSAAPGVGKWMFDATTQTVYYGDGSAATNPSTKAVEFTVRDIFLKWGSAATNAQMRGVGVLAFGGVYNVKGSLPWAAVISSATGTRIDYCTFYDNSARGASFNASGSYCERNLFLYQGLNAVHANLADDLVLERNRIGWANDAYFDIGIGVTTWGNQIAGAKVTKTARAVIRYNVVHDCKCNGLWLDVIPTIDCTIACNRVLRCDGFGITSEITDRTVIAYNEVVGCGRDGIKNASNDDGDTWNNTVYDCAWAKVGTKWWADSSSTGHQLSYYLDSRKDITNPTGRGRVKNNVLVATVRSSNSGDRVFLVEQQTATIPSVDVPAARAAEALVSANDYNAFGRTTANTPASLIKWCRADESQISYSTLAAYRTTWDTAPNGNREHNSPAEQNGVAATALFVDPSGGPTTSFAIVATHAWNMNGATLPLEVEAAVFGTSTGTVVPKIGADSALLPPWIA